MGRIVLKGQETTRVCAQPTSVGRGLVFDDLSVCFIRFGVVHEIGCSRLAVWQGETVMTKRKFLTPEQEIAIVRAHLLMAEWLEEQIQLKKKLGHPETTLGFLGCLR